MTLLEAIKARHSVRKYQNKPIDGQAVLELNAQIDEANQGSGLHMQLVLNEPRAFKGILSYGKFYGVENYIVVVGKKFKGKMEKDKLAKSTEEQAGYYGEKIVLLAQTLGLNTCWVGLTYRKVTDAFTIADDEKLYCVIAIGYGVTQGVSHKIKSAEQVSNVSAETPEWFRHGVEAALLAPTAMNQQKFHFEYQAPAQGKKPKVATKRKFSMFGYTEMDLGIAKYHFEIGAGKENFEYAE